MRRAPENFVRWKEKKDGLRETFSFFVQAVVFANFEEQDH